MGLSSHISHLGINVTHNSFCIWSCLHAYWPRESVRNKKCWHSIQRTSLNEYYTNSITLRGLPFPENCPVNFKPLTQCTFKEPRVGYCRHLLCMFFISTRAACCNSRVSFTLKTIVGCCYCCCFNNKLTYAGFEKSATISVFTYWNWKLSSNITTQLKTWQVVWQRTFSGHTKPQRNYNKTNTKRTDNKIHILQNDGSEYR